MSIKIVVLDAARLPAGVDFPPLAAEKYGWEQYPQLAEDDIAERCWRADIVVTLGSAIEAASLEKMIKLGLLICAGDACGRVDQVAATGRGIEILAFPDAPLDSVAGAQTLCQRISAAIDYYIRCSRRSETDA